MNILQIHNDYKILGGETKVVENEKKLLEYHGHNVTQFLDENIRIDKFDFLDRIKFFKNAFFDHQQYLKLKAQIKKVCPDIIHVHNVFPLISPSAYYAAHEANVPVVQTIHNFRFLCPNGLFLRNNEICELCKNGSYFNAIKYRCYKDSFVFSSLYACSIKYHRVKKTFYDKIDVLIALSAFSKNKLIEGGFSAKKIIIKPNFLSYNHSSSSLKIKDNYFIFIGRLSKEKGIHTLLHAAKALPEQQIKIIGNGEELDYINRFISLNKLTNISVLGFLDGQEKYNLIQKAKSLIFPSVWYENFPITILESYLSGTPVIASNIGSLPEIVNNNRTGLLFKSGDSYELAAKLKWAIDHPEEMKQMGINARKEFEEKYTAKRNYQMLIDIYKKAIENKNIKNS